jgi:His-Xaa-Ser system radical SAM maturase HxsC
VDEPTPDDAALALSVDDLKLARQSGFAQAFVIGGAKDLVAVAGEFSSVYVVPEHFNYLGDGDVIGMDPRSGRFRVHYRRSSSHNSFLVTERCNHYCLMCSQPPKDIDDRWILKEIRNTLPLIDRTTKTLGFTGGEPLLDWDEFIDVLGVCRDALPNTAVHVLSNGRGFARNAIVDAWSSLKHSDLMAGIPIYAAVDHVHDYVVQAEGAFDETLLGILKLKDRGARVEMRVVLHAVTVPHLVHTCRWLARNLPFVDHVALMGLENTGFAIANDGMLWIDPVDYEGELACSVEALAAAGMNVSIYNLPLCVLHETVRPFAIRSISDWKNGYGDECMLCTQRMNCAGMFTSGRPKLSRGIRAIA